jgi:hypothetical protein
MKSKVVFLLCVFSFSLCANISPVKYFCQNGVAQIGAFNHLNSYELWELNKRCHILASKYCTESENIKNADFVQCIQNIDWDCHDKFISKEYFACASETILKTSGSCLSFHYAWVEATGNHLLDGKMEPHTISTTKNCSDDEKINLVRKQECFHTDSPEEFCENYQEPSKQCLVNYNWYSQDN